MARIFQLLAWLVVAGLAVEFYLAGAAVFGVTTFQSHRLLGVLLAVAILFLLLVAAIVRPGRRTLGQVALLAALVVVQLVLPRLQPIAPAIAALHVINAGILVGLAIQIARPAGRPSTHPASRPISAPLGSAAKS